MKTIHEHPALGYRNDTVFRSAERLLASSGPRRWGLRLLGWSIFLGTLALGTAFVIFGWNRWIPSPAPIAISVATVGPRASSTISQIHRTGTENQSATFPASLQSTAPMPNSREVNPAQPQAIGPLAQVSSTELFLPAPALFLRTAPRHLGAVDPWISTTRPLLRLSLRGELRAANAAPLTVELLFWRAADANSQTLGGVVRYFVGESRVAVNGVKGNFDGHTVRLLETGEVGVRATGFPVGRQFVLQFPSDATAGEVIGTWTLGAQSGAVVLGVTATR